MASVSLLTMQQLHFEQRTAGGTSTLYCSTLSFDFEITGSVRQMYVLYLYDVQVGREQQRWTLSQWTTWVTGTVVEGQINRLNF